MCKSYITITETRSKLDIRVIRLINNFLLSVITEDRKGIRIFLAITSKRTFCFL